MSAVDCGHVKPGASGYAPCTWTYCTREPDHEGSHSGPEFGHGPVQTWAPTDAFGRPLAISTTPEGTVGP